MKKIPIELKEKMSSNPYYLKCCIRHVSECSGKIEWHHNLIFKGNQVNEEWCILPVCKRHHDMANNKYTRENLDCVMLNRVSNTIISPFCKAVDWLQRKKYLNSIYGIK